VQKRDDRRIIRSKAGEAVAQNIALLTTVFRRFYGARRALYVVETAFSSKFESVLSARFKALALPQITMLSGGLANHF
jgi:hypothetical protein